MTKTKLSKGQKRLIQNFHQLTLSINPKITLKELSTKLHTYTWQTLFDYTEQERKKLTTELKYTLPQSEETISMPEQEPSISEIKTKNLRKILRKDSTTRDSLSILINKIQDDDKEIFFNLIKKYTKFNGKLKSNYSGRWAKIRNEATTLNPIFEHCTAEEIKNFFHNNKMKIYPSIKPKLGDHNKTNNSTTSKQANRTRKRKITHKESSNNKIQKTNLENRKDTPRSQKKMSKKTFNNQFKAVNKKSAPKSKPYSATQQAQFFTTKNPPCGNTTVTKCVASIVDSSDQKTTLNSLPFVDQHILDHKILPGMYQQLPDHFFNASKLDYFNDLPNSEDLLPSDEEPDWDELFNEIDKSNNNLKMQN